MNVKVLLKKEIESELGTLEDMELGSEPHKVAIDGVVKLIDKYNEMEKIDLEYQEKYENRKAEKEMKTEENDLKRQQLKEEQFDHMIKNGLTLATFVGGAALAIWGTYVSIKFEETGTITTLMGRGWINKLLPKK